MKYFLFILTSALSITASQRVVNWMKFPSHHSSPNKQFYLELEFNNPSVWVSNWGDIDSQGRIDIIRPATQTLLLFKRYTLQGMPIQ